MKFKLLLRRLSISAPRMTVKTQRPWPFTLLLLVIAIGLGGAVALWTYDLGREFAGIKRLPAPDALAYQAQLQKLSTERDRFSTTVNSAESQLTIERTAKQQLAAQVKGLEAENTKLKEDLAFFESLLPTDTGTQDVAVRRLTIDVIGPNQLRYRMLLMQGGRGKTDFSGNLELALTTLQGGRSTVVLYPRANDSDRGKYKLQFRHYQRIEGILVVPDGAGVRSLQVRVLEKGQLRAQASANL